MAPLEDFTLMTEADANGRYAVTATTIIVTSLKRNDLAHFVYKDQGAGVIGDITLGTEFDIINSGGGNASAIFVYIISDLIGDFIDHNSIAEPGFTIFMNRSGGGAYALFIQGTGGVGPFDLTAMPTSSRRYLTVTRAAGVMTVKVYSDAARLTLLDTIAISHLTGSYRYQYVVSSYGSATAGAMSGDVRNYEIKDVVEEEEGPSLLSFKRGAARGVNRGLRRAA